MVSEKQRQVLIAVHNTLEKPFNSCRAIRSFTFIFIGGCSAFFGLANDCLRNGPIDASSAPVLFNLDEIGNIPLPDLPAALGVGRGRRMTYALGYQNIAQLYHQYGQDGGDAVLGSVGAMIFLPASINERRNMHLRDWV